MDNEIINKLLNKKANILQKKMKEMMNNKLNKFEHVINKILHDIKQVKLK